jgi:enoyl-CoA hydratase/carnithine racemase
MQERVTYELTDGVADVRMVRPDKLNALDGAMFAQLISVGAELTRMDSLRAVVLSGEGRAFCAGLDMGSFAQMGEAAADSDGPAPRSLLAREDGRTTTDAQQACWVWAEMPVPTIAALNGVAYGGGFQLALAADIRIAAPDTRMSVMEVKWGLVPDMTGTQLLPELVGRDVAKELTFTGRVVEADECKELGLITRIDDDPHHAALELAKLIATKSPSAVRYAKRLLDQAGRVSLGEGFQAEAELQTRLIGSPNQIESVLANFEKRPPKFANFNEM